MQILQNPITIRANGYFTVNLKSLMKILANIATYLIILMQFRKANVNEESIELTTTISNMPKNINGSLKFHIEDN
ncbi:uncharacterized protein LOC111679236 [Lucilia cuprina]|uniref:uncharacterized protein LOC111679236 n=1 Tax=Lucilia cuprina TaxID=7375 RepID=UPI001F065FEF|nr:uncharacterized protein LOC111679236 [Lucilia cuprina]